MKKRKRLSRSKSKKNFRKGTGIKAKNVLGGNIMRGGIRL